MNKIGNFSENEDDPDGVYESSGDEWDYALEKKRNRRTSQRLSKKQKIVYSDTSDSDDYDDDDFKKSVNTKRKNTVVQKNTTNTSSDSVKILAGNFTSGSFIILKKDAQSGDINKPPCLWRVDGKALLQKYEPFVEDGKVKHRNTSIYTGWSAMDKDLYAPITVDVSQHQGQNFVVEFNWDTLKEINMDSD